MKPYRHAVNSAKRYGGVPDDYIKIHNFFDSTKSAYADIRHRAVLHSTFGIFLAEQIFGVTIRISTGKILSVRDIAEDHVIEDIGRIPTIENWLDKLPLQEWMTGKGQREFSKRTRIPLDEGVTTVDGQTTTTHTVTVEELGPIEEMTVDGPRVDMVFDGVNRWPAAGEKMGFHLSPGVTVEEIDG